MSFIEKLQKKSRSTRLLILWLATFLIMLIIIIIWLLSFSRGFGIQEMDRKAEGTDLPSVFESLGKDFSIIKEKLEAALKDIQIKKDEEAE